MQISEVFIAPFAILFTAAMLYTACSHLIRIYWLGPDSVRRRRRKIIGGLLLLFGFIGFLAWMCLEIIGPQWLPRPVRWLICYRADAIQSPHGEIAVYLRQSSKLQIYSPDWTLLRQWPLTFDTLDEYEGHVQIQFADADLIVVHTSRAVLVYTLDGTQSKIAPTSISAEVSYPRSKPEWLGMVLISPALPAIAAGIGIFLVRKRGRHLRRLRA